MGNIAKRIGRAEGRLGLDQKPMTINIVWFGGKPVPPDERHDNTIVYYVPYEAIREQSERARRP
jgi:hypothetical protein